MESLIVPALCMLTFGIFLEVTFSNPMNSEMCFRNKLPFAQDFGEGVAAILETVNLVCGRWRDGTIVRSWFVDLGGIQCMRTEARFNACGRGRATSARLRRKRNSKQAGVVL